MTTRKELTLTKPNDHDMAIGVLAEIDGVSKKRLCCTALEYQLALAKAVKEATVKALDKFKDYQF